MAKSTTSKDRPKIADVWDMSDLQFPDAETEIMCRFDLFEDGDWKQAILAAITALENGLPIPVWAASDVLVELRRAIKLEPLPPSRPKGRGSPTRKYIDGMNHLAVVAAVDAAIELGKRGEKKFQAAEEVLNREGVPRDRTSAETIHKNHRNKLRKHGLYPVMYRLFIEAISKRSNQ